jgi:hypothetical protein
LFGGVPSWWSWWSWCTNGEASVWISILRLQLPCLMLYFELVYDLYVNLRYCCTLTESSKMIVSRPWCGVEIPSVPQRTEYPMVNTQMKMQRMYTLAYWREKTRLTLQQLTARLVSCSLAWWWWLIPSFTAVAWLTEVVPVAFWHHHRIIHACDLVSSTTYFFMTDLKIPTKTPELFAPRYSTELNEQFERAT